MLTLIGLVTLYSHPNHWIAVSTEPLVVLDAVALSNDRCRAIVHVADGSVHASILPLGRELVSC